MANKSNVTLEDFIEKYTASKKKSQKTYSQFLNERGNMSEANYAQAVNEAQKEYDRARAGYGKQGELLGRKGLGGSGYASFLDSNAYSELQNSKREAEKARNIAETKNRSAYASYLENADSARDKLVGNAIDDIYRYGSDDYETSYKLAIASGLDKETAKYAAEIGSALTEDTNAEVSIGTRRTLLGELISGRFTGENAIAYLIACGINEKDATLMAETAEKIRGSRNNISGSGLFD